jgi:hypothetical protein
MGRPALPAGCAKRQVACEWLPVRLTSSGSKLHRVAPHGVGWPAWKRTRSDRCGIYFGIAGLACERRRAEAICAEMADAYVLPAWGYLAAPFRSRDRTTTCSGRVAAPYKNARRGSFLNEFGRRSPGLKYPDDQGAGLTSLDRRHRMAGGCGEAGGRWRECHDGQPDAATNGGRWSYGGMASTRGALSRLRRRSGAIAQSGGDLDGPVYSAPPWSDHPHIAPGERAGEPQAPNPTGVPQGL